MASAHDEASDESSAHDGDRTVVVGLLCDPGLPSEVVRRFTDDLEADLSVHVTDEVEWDVRMRTEPLRIDDEDQFPLVNLSKIVLPKYKWDLLVCVTDLPRRIGTHPVVADISVSNGVALASLPALGVWRMRRRLYDTLIYLVGELGKSSLLSVRAGRERREAGSRLKPVRWVDHSDAEIEVSLALVGWRGRLRLLAGMVRGNKPWRLVPELSTALAAGSAAAAFGIFYGSIWTLADALSPFRQVLISLLAIASMVTWLILYNRLWERRSSSREKAILYNVSTLASLLFGVAAAYSVLFAVTLMGALTVIDPGYLEQSLGHPVGIVDYLRLTWLSSSLGTFAGALGSSLESEEAVYRAAYSMRERQRRQRAREQQEQEAREHYGD
ncbi:hypothetical protein [Saccharomonospora sp.]|uniref:hypothetical protein n=1 Tax=Saccharomonospora sp. TaxID=33913 RepID=UPI0026227827|nr:hypothetical protein [Saccharomonospora sp.]